jgi:hypothetical protein
MATTLFSPSLVSKQEKINEETRARVRAISAELAKNIESTDNTSVDIKPNFQCSPSSESQDEFVFSYDIPDVEILSDEHRCQIIEQYEQQFGMTSEEFIERWKSGAMPDTFETNDWAILLTSN